MNAKRALDIGLGSLALVLATPLLAGIGLAMRLSGDRGPFLYRSRRVGEGGQPFTLLKVRTMAAGADGPRLTSLRDSRVTPVGRVVRRFRFDELPQLVNVLRGEMSLVGPRPEDPSFVDFGKPLHRLVYSARPGITGLAQLEFHDEARLMTGPDPETLYREVIQPEKLRLDAEYLEHPSLGVDLRILGRTVLTVLGRGSARPDDP